MAVRHGYGKIAGTDALVFAYDTGDTRNSYRGEPTVNLANTDAFRTMTQYADNTVASADAPERGPGWKKLTITARGTNFRIAKFPYITQPTNTVRTYSMEIDFNGTSGYYIRGDGFSGFSPNQYTSGIYTSTFTTTTNNGSLALFLNNGSTSVTGINDVIYYRYYQVEDKPHRTQFTEGTRSATQGLLDLTGNKTISLTNTSFDANAQPAFDGTEEYFDLGSDQVFKTSGGWTVENIVRYDSVAGGYDNYISPANFIGSDTISYNSWYWSVLSNKLALWNISPGIWKYGSTTIQPNTWYHVALVSYDNGTQYQMYLNGVAEGGDHTTYSWNATYSGLRVRYIGAGQSTRRFVNGEIPVTKIYNRALTAAEVRNNYNQYKGRFNI